MRKRNVFYIHDILHKLLLLPLHCSLCYVVHVTSFTIDIVRYYIAVVKYYITIVKYYITIAKCYMLKAIH